MMIDTDNTKPSLIDELISRAKAATLENYSDFMQEVAELTTSNTLDDIQRNAIIETLSKNKAIGSGAAPGKKLITNNLQLLERDLRPQQPAKGIQGGHGYYRVADDGIFISTGGDAIPICSRLDALAETRTIESNGWGRLLEWRDNDNRLHRWAMPATLTAGEGNEAIKYLLDNGLHIIPGRAKNVIDYVMSAPVEGKLTSTDKTGWHNDAFVTADQVYGSDEYVFQSETGVNAAISTQGSLKQWREQVAAKAVGNSRIIFAICTAFAGSLLERSGVDSGGFHIHGTSTDGKSTAQFIAASVWGPPRQYARTWRATANGLEGTATIHNDGLLILDEIGQANPKDIGEVSYMLANGQNKARMHHSTASRKPLTWRLLFLSSGEYTLSDMMKTEGKRIFAGQELRLANIPSDAGANMGVFENIYGAETPARFADQLKQAIQQNYGHAGDAWLTMLTKKSEWRQSVKTELDSFVKEVATDVNQQAGRVARRFALVAFAGELATKEGITGWKSGEATKAAKACFYAWLKNYGTGNREHKNILDAVKAFIEGSPARFQKVYPASQIVEPGKHQTRIEEARAEARPIQNRIGFKIYNDADEPELYILASNLAECASGYTANEIKEALHNAGWIDSTQAGQKKIPEEGNKRIFRVNVERMDV